MRKPGKLWVEKVKSQLTNPRNQLSYPIDVDVDVIEQHQKGWALSKYHVQKTNIDKNINIIFLIFISLGVIVS